MILFRPYLLIITLWIVVCILSPTLYARGGGGAFGEPNIESMPDSGLIKKMNGYIKAEYYYDSRQVTGFTVDQYLLFPKPKLPDPDGEDINKRAEGHAVAIESRVALAFGGKKYRCADVSGVIEADFWGPGNIDADAFLNATIVIPNVFRMRHAAIFFKWPSVTLTLGQYWHPMSTVDCIADTISFNGGAPTNPFARNPLIEIDYERSGYHIIGCASYQLDFDSVGPLGFNYKYQALGLVPNFDLLIKKEFEHHVIGACFDYNRIVPRIVSASGYSVFEPLSAYSAMGYLSLHWPEKFRFNQKLTYAQNGPWLACIGGFGVHEIDCCTDKRTYTNINSLSYFWDLTALPAREVEPGMFIGVTKNLGASKSVIPTCSTFTQCDPLTEQTIFGFGVDINILFRVAPRFRWHLNENLTFAAELECTYAQFGDITTSGKVVNTTPATNIRSLVAMYHTF